MGAAIVDREFQSWPADPAELRDQGLPLVVNLERTLVKTSLQLESLIGLLKQSPLTFLFLPFWLLRGTAYLAEQIDRRSSLDVGLLPYRSEFLNYLQTERAQGREIVLCTARNPQLAQRVADYLMLFDTVLAPETSTDRSSTRLRDRLVHKFGERGFDYAGSNRSDISVLSSARKIILVSSTGRGNSVRGSLEIDRIFRDPKRPAADYVKPLRPQHWLKNVLVFVPVFAAHRFGELVLLERSLIAFLALCCCASAGYLLNDLADLAADRRHPHKRFRSFAAGALPLSYALGMASSLVILGFALSIFLSQLFALMTLVYFATSLTYSLFLKKVALLDVIVLAGLYTLRIMCGSAAVVIWPSHWLLAFSGFLFLSLALVKRYGELVIVSKADGEKARARGYELGDAELLAAKGVTSGYLAVLVLALYITSGPAGSLYGRHELMWFLCPLLLYWIGHMWLVAHRGKMSDDPVVFATSDRTSRILILLMLCNAVLAL